MEMVLDTPSYYKRQLTAEFFIYRNGVGGWHLSFKMYHTMIRYSMGFHTGTSFCIRMYNHNLLRWY